MKQRLLTILLTLLPLLASADAVEINGIYYNLIEKAGQAEVTQNPNKYSGSVVIPESIVYGGKTYSVTSIGKEAFYFCSGLTSVTIPNSVTSIGKKSFSGCSGLTSVTIPNSVTSIGEDTFAGCSSLTSVTIPNSVTFIGGYALQNCSSLTSVTIPNSVTSIGECTFAGCSSLTSMTIPNSVTSIGRSAFSHCSGLTSVTIPNSVTSIGEGAFYECSGLTSVTIPNSVTTIGNSAFYGCSGLTSITLGSDVKTIDSKAFANCSELTDVYCIAETVPNTNSNAFEGSYIDYTTLHVPEISINSYKAAEPWKNFKKIVSLSSTSKSYTMTVNVSEHGKVTYGETDISNGSMSFDVEEGADVYLTFTPENGYRVSSVSVNNESRTSNVTNGTLIINNVSDDLLINVVYAVNAGITGVVEIDGIYYYLNQDKQAKVIENPNKYSGDVTIPQTITNDGVIYNVTSIGDGAFFKCSDLTSLTIPDGVISIGNSAFSRCSSLTSVAIPNSVTSIGGCVFSECSSLISVTIPNSVTSIGESAFYFCSGLISVTIPNSVTSIGDNFFSGCSSLISVTIPNSVTSIGKCAFDGCSGLTSVTIPNSVTTIDDGSFRGCGLTAVTIPNSVTFIGERAFEYCRSLISVTIPNGVTSIGRETFLYCRSLTSMTIPNSVTSIGENAFLGCRSLTSVTIPNSVTSIGESAFCECLSLASVTIPNSVTSIGEKAFDRCISLTSVTIPNSVTSIGDFVFSGCSGLISVTIPNSVIIIGESAFANCSSITSISLPDNLKMIKNRSFYNCSGLTSITIPATVEVIYQEAFAGCSSLEQINALPTTPPFIYDKTFSDYSVPLKVPSGCVEAYKNAEFWKNFTNISDGTKIYKLTYIIDGKEFKTIDVLYGSEITPEPNPTKEGYTFSGWSEIPETMPAHDVTITGTFTINKYKLIYMVDGVEYKSFEIEYNSAITPEPDPTKDGYIFSGWSEIPETMPAHDVTITGSFERVYSGGDVANLIDLLLFGDVDDEDIALYDMNGDGELNIGDLILIIRAAQSNSRNRSAANRGAAENQTIEFAADIVTMKPGETSALNISLSSSISGIYGIQFEVNLPEGFSLEKGRNDKIYEMSANQVDDITCNDRDLGNGTYRFFIYSCTLQELKGGSLMSLNLKADADKTLGNYSVSISNVALSDYDGHVAKEDGSSVGVKVTNSFTLLYQVDGEDYKSYEMEYGESITPEAEPTKEGYTFSGWSEIPETMPAEDVIVKGTFTVNQYILTYVVDGEVYKEYSYDYGSTITPEVEPTKEGYTFSGWSEIPETMPAKEVYVVGTFTINKYKITYVIDGAVYLTEEVEYGSWITPPNPGNREGYDFAWEDYPDSMPAEDITINGTYTKIDVGNTINGYEYVDLGLPSGLLWATKNVGATNPAEYGSYFAWGETSPKSQYLWLNYKYADGTNTLLTKYCYSSEYGTVDNKRQLDIEDDAACYNWGGTWRMPTAEESQELYRYCTFTKTSQNGVQGFELTGPNGNKIFFPAGGFISYTINMDKDQGCIVLTSTIWGNHPDFASVFYINDSGPNYSYGWGREQGYSVRAVSGENTSNINPINKDDDEVGRYTLNGVMVNKPVKGINIIRTSNGKAKKVYVK